MRTISPPGVSARWRGIVAAEELRQAVADANGSASGS